MRTWIEKHRNKYKARIRLADGTNRSKTFDLKRDAQDWLDQQRADWLRGNYIDQRNGKIPFATWVGTYRTMLTHLAPGTLANKESHLKNWVLPRWGPVSLIDISRPHVQAWVSEQAVAGRNAGSILLSFQTLSNALQAAVECEMINRNPCTGVKLPQYEQHEMQVVTLDTVMAIADAIHPMYRALVVLGGTGGLRMGELAGLRVGQLDFFRKHVLVSEQLRLVNGKPEFAQLKTKMSKRTVGLPPFVLDELRRHIATFGLGQNDLMFTSTQGQVLRAYQFRRRYFYPATAKVGLSGFRVHDLRHSAIALWISTGANPKEIQAKAGHSSIKVTFDTYGHLFPDYDTKMRDGLEAMYRDLKPTAKIVPIKR